MKKCGKCDEVKELTEFFKKKGKPQSYCKQCTKESRDKHYSENKAQYQLKMNEYRQENRNFIAEIKAKSKCERCPENHPSCLDFHHLKDKEFTIADGISYSRENLAEEIKKCIILCSNCHRKLHYEEKKSV